MNTPGQSNASKEQTRPCQTRVRSIFMRGMEAAFIICIFLPSEPVSARSIFCPEILDPNLGTCPGELVECDVIEATNCEIEMASADVTFRATDQVILGAGFAVRDNAQFRVDMVGSHYDFYCGSGCH